MYAGNGIYGSRMEAHTGVLELKAGPAKLKVGANVDTGAGLWGGQAFLKVLGFGASVGGNGIGIHTPIGSLCLVRCS